MKSDRRFYGWALALLISTVLVILWGAFVRVTGSGAGCADHWPLCNGEFIPRSRPVETLIELTHRVTSSLSGLLSIVVFVLSRRSFERGSTVRKAAATGLFLMLLEGAIGALLVKKGLVAKDRSEARALVVGLHLVNTFLLLGAQLATLYFARVRDVRAMLRSSWSLWLLLALSLFLVLGASGAVTALGDTLFPAETLAAGMQRDFAQDAHFLERLRVYHPLFAVAVGALVVFLAQQISGQQGTSQTRRGALLVTITYVLQMALGSLNYLLMAPASVQILHLLLADLTWLALCYLTLVALFPAQQDQASLASAAS